MARVRFTALARTDLREIEAYIARENPAAARRVIDEIYTTLKAISRTPVCGEVCHQMAEGMRRLATRRYKYVIYFQPVT